MRSYTKPAVVILTGLSLASALAGCSTPDATPPATGTGTYTDGTYTESGDYQAPSGTETVEVTITLSDNTITAVEVVGDATDPQAKLHQGEFISGIAGVVVGKNIDSIQVDKVGGSSLTSGGFNAAVDAIKADAGA
jgi:uncharacterized protein with FMN-binding domain